jgi:hypothetical protein
MYKLRSAANSDYNFLYSLLTITMKQHYIETYGKWDDEVERRYFDDSFRDCEYQIISYDEHSIGCLVKKTNPSEIFIYEIQIFTASHYVVVVLANLDPPSADEIIRFISDRLPVN